MAARTASEHVLAALRGYDRDLGVVWNDDSAAWELTWQGMAQGWSLRHLAGNGLIRDLYADEVLDIVAVTDLRKYHQDEWRRRRKETLRFRANTVEHDKAKAAAELAERERDARRWLRQGGRARPQVFLHNQSPIQERKSA